MHVGQTLLKIGLGIAVLTSCETSNKKGTEAAPVPVDSVQHSSPAPAPAWTLQSNIYEVNVRQYTKEGTFRAFEPSLSRLKEMGVEILWFMPITPISKTDRKGRLGSYYAVQNYTAINPEFGTMEDWKALVKRAHGMGFKVITDWVANHTGADHSWLTRHPDFFTRDKNGKVISPFDWTDTRDLNYDNRELRDSMIAAMKFWISQSDIDGFRCDVAGEVPADFWKECITALKKEKDVFMLAEGDKGELHRAGFNASYPWTMFASLKAIAAGKKNALAIDTVLSQQDSTFPAGAVRMYFTSNHDENSWNKSDYGTFPGLVHAPFAVFTQTMRNTLPLIYSGQEEQVLRKIEFFEKDNMHFGKYGRASFYKALLTLRKRTPALATDASFRKVSAGDDKALYAYVREKEAHKILVILNLSGKEQPVSIKDASLEGKPYNVFLFLNEPINPRHSFNLEPWGYVVYDYDR